MLTYNTFSFLFPTDITSLLVSKYIGAYSLTFVDKGLQMNQGDDDIGHRGERSVQDAIVDALA